VIPISRPIDFAPPVPLFADLLGQDLATNLLAAALRSRRLAPAYLFAGPDGVGRRLAALRFLEGVAATKPASGAQAAALDSLAGDARIRRLMAQGNHPDLLWLEPTFQHQGRLIPASQAAESGISRKVPPQLRLEQIREVSRFLSRRPVESGRCMVVLESVESMAETVANALLKTLEEPGDGVLVLISAAPDRLLATIRSRCQRIPFRPLAPEQVRAVLRATPSAAADGTSRMRWLAPLIPPNSWNWRGAPPAACWPTAGSGIPCPRGWPIASWPWGQTRWNPWPWPGFE